jgi:hypothetical protein
MSHNPESHHGHEKIIGPDDDGFEWPLVEKRDQDGNYHRAMHPTTYATTHRYPDGYYYTIDDNKDVSEAGNRLYDEAHVKDPLKYGLYRIGEHGKPIRPESPDYDDGQALDTGAFVFDADGNGYKSNNEKRDIDARATPIIASYEARDRALREGKSIDEAEAIGAEVYNVHFGMAGTPINPSYSRNQLPAGHDHHQEQLPNGETAQEEDQTRSRRRRFGRSATGSAFRTPRPGSRTEQQPFGEAADFLHGVRRAYPDSAWLKEISDEDMQTLMNEVRTKRAQLVRDGVTDKQKQDGRIYRSYRIQLETDQNAGNSLKQAHGVLWDLMGEDPKGDIPF